MSLLMPGDDHNLLGNRHNGDPHRQYYRRNSPLGTVKPPLILDGTGLGPMSYLWIIDNDGNDLATFYYNTSPSVVRGVQFFVSGASSAGGFKILRNGTSTVLFSVNPDLSPAGIFMNLDQYATANMVVAKKQRYVPETYTFSASPVNPLPLPTRHIIRLDPNGSSRTVQGITADTAGFTYNDTSVFEFINVAAFGSGFDINWEDETSTVAADRVITGTGTTVVQAPQQTFRIWYDDTTARWRILS